MLKKIDFKSIVMRVGGIGAGAIAANAVSKILPPNMKPNLKAAIILGAGAIIPEFAGGGKKAGIVRAVCDGMIAFGALALAKAQFSLDLNISGFEGLENRQVVEYAPAEVVNKVELAEAVNGIAEIADALAGSDDVASPDEDVASLDEDIAYVSDEFFEE
jgi:hypothetical protein